MCGVVAYFGKVNPLLVEKVIEESLVRGLHNIGRKDYGTHGVAHTRYCTSGETNQPIKFGSRYLVFNGVIHMGTKEEMEDYYKLSLATDNDGEVFLRKAASPDAMVGFLMKNACTFAGVVVDSKSMVAIRNEKRPLWKIEVKHSVIIASTLDILRRAGADWRKAEELEPLTPYVWKV